MIKIRFFLFSLTLCTLLLAGCAAGAGQENAPTAEPAIETPAGTEESAEEEPTPDGQDQATGQEASGSATEGMPPEPAEDFNFVFQFGACFTDSLDTSAGTFTQDMGKDEAPITIPLELTPEQMATIYQKMVEIDLYGYPAVYEVPQQEGIAMTTMPNEQYYIEVENDGHIKTVEWALPLPLKEDGPPEVQQLRELADLIRGMIEARPEIQELPERGSACF